MQILLSQSGHRIIDQFAAIFLANDKTACHSAGNSKLWCWKLSAIHSRKTVMIAAWNVHRMSTAADDNSTNELFIVRVQQIENVRTTQRTCSVCLQPKTTQKFFSSHEFTTVTTHACSVSALQLPTAVLANHCFFFSFLTIKQQYWSNNKNCHCNKFVTHKVIFTHYDTSSIAQSLTVPALHPIYG